MMSNFSYFFKKLLLKKAFEVLIIIKDIYTPIIFINPLKSCLFIHNSLNLVKKSDNLIHTLQSNRERIT